MEQKMVSLFVPSLNQTYDLLLPASIAVNVLIRLVVKSITDMSGGRYCPSGQEKLCRTNPDSVLIGVQTLAENSISTGTCLVLI